VTGKTLLHLQCHFGMDSLSWARLGATVTGVDFSPRAIAAARRLAMDSGTPARFVEAELYDAPDVLPEQFDVDTVTYEWNHGLGEIVSAVLHVGVTLTGLEGTTSPSGGGLPWLVRGDDGRYRLPPGRPRIPLMYTLTARRPRNPKG
jgi:SAM-dependent methyltransferase